MATTTGIVRFGSFIGGSISTAAGFAAGAATAPTLRPILQALENSTWARLPTRPLDAGVAAAIVAEDVDRYQWGEDEAANTGIDPTRFRDLYGETLNAPGLGELYQALRRDGITDADFLHGLRKAKFEGRWDDALLALRSARLAPAQVALGIVRSLIVSKGLLVGEHDTTGGVVPSTPVSPIDPVAEAKAWGISEERLRVMVGEIGLPMSLQQAASAYFRGIIKHPDFYLAVAQGDTRPAWADAILEQARAILSPNQYAELELRGFLDREHRLAKTDQYGMSHADSDQLYNLLGRSIPVHQITTGRARGGVYNGPTGDIPDDYLASLERGNLRREYFNLAYANRYSYPSGFQIRGEAQAGRLTRGDTYELLLEVGWSPKWAAHFADSWTIGTAAKGDPHISKAATQLWNAAHRSYLTGELIDADAIPALEAAGVAADKVPAVLALWATEANITRKRLTAPQIKKAYDKAAKNEATGQPWTRDEAIFALQAWGYPPLAAADYLNIPSGK